MKRYIWTLLGAFLSSGPATAFGAIISLDTHAASNWRVQRILVGGESNGTAYNGPVLEVKTIPPGANGTPGVSGAWLTFHDPALTPYDLAAQWISWNVNTGAEVPRYQGDVSGTRYKYTYLLNAIPEGPTSTFNLSGYMSFDNIINTVTLTANGVPLNLNLTSTPNTVNSDGFPVVGFLYTLNLSSPYAFSNLTQFLLTVDGVNSNAAGSNPTSTGFIFSGDIAITPVPEPMTASVLLPGAILLLGRRLRRNVSTLS